MASIATPLGVESTPARSANSAQLLRTLDVSIPAVKPPKAYAIALIALAITLILIATAFAALVLFMAWLVVWHVMGAILSLSQGPYFIFHVPMAFLGLTLLAFLLKPIFLRRKVKEPHIISLTAKDEPLLFEFVEKLCRIVGAKPPAIIEVDCDANASARLRKGLRSLFRGDLVLRIGLPLVAAFPVQQLAGVLAHEFGHFNQQHGMAWSYLIRRLNYFFAQLVFQRDRLDAWLARFRTRRNNAGVLIYYVAAALIEPARGVLWLMLIIGEILTCQVLRRMEYDADTVAAHVAGAREFGRTHQLISFLSIAANQTRHDLAAAYETRRLPDDLPQLTVSRARLLSKHKAEILQSLKQEKTRWFDTHPSHTDRVNNVEKLAAAGAVLCDRPASVLFHDFPNLCRRASEGYYRSVIGDKLKEITLVPAADLAAQQTSQRDAIQQIRRYFQDQLLGSRPVFPGPDAATAPADPDAAACELTAAREEMTILARKMGKSTEAHEKASARLAIADAHMALAAIAMNPVAANQIRARAQSERREAQPLLADACLKLDVFEKLGARRLTIGLQLLTCPTIAQRLDGDAAAAQQAAAGWLNLCDRLGACQPHLNDARKRALQARTLYVTYQNNTPFRPLEQNILATLAATVASLKAVVDSLGDVPYPFEHGTQSITCAAHLIPHMPDPKNITEVTETAMGACNRYGDLSFQVLAQLVTEAERVETALGLPPLADPDDKARQAAARQEAAVEHRRGARKYWLTYSARAAVGTTLLCALVWLSLDPPTLPAMPWEDERPAGVAYRPASFTWTAPARTVTASYQPSVPPGQPNYFQPGNPGYFQPGHPGYQSGMPTYGQPGYGQYGQPGQPGHGQPGQPGYTPLPTGIGQPGWQPTPGMPGYRPPSPQPGQPGQPGFPGGGGYQPPQPGGPPRGGPPSPGGGHR